MSNDGNFLTRTLQKAIDRRIEKAWLPFGSGMTDALMGAGAPVWLSNNKENLVEKGFMMNPSVYMIVSWITRQASQIPWVLYEVKDDKALRRYKSMDPNDWANTRIMERKALEEISGHQVQDVWAHPNELQGTSEFIEQWLGFKLITGDTYLHGRGPETGPNQGNFLAFDVLPAHLIGIKYGNRMEPVSHYYWLGAPNSRMDPETILHSKFWSPLPLNRGGLHGMSPLQAASRLITRNNDSITASVKSLQNMGAIGMLSRYVGTPGEKGLTAEQAQLIEKKYYEKFGGASNAGKIMVTGAAVKWQQMGMSPVDLKILEQEQKDLRDLCGVYNLQSQLFNDPENKTYNNMKEAVVAGLTQCVIPNLRQLRDQLNSFWIQPLGEREGKKLWFDLDTQAIPELQKNFKEMLDWLDKASMLTLNEQREVLDYEPLPDPGMDKVWMDGGKVTPEQAMMDTGEVDKYLDSTKL